MVYAYSSLQGYQLLEALASFKYLIQAGQLRDLEDGAVVGEVSGRLQDGFESWEDDMLDGPFPFVVFFHALVLRRDGTEEISNVIDRNGVEKRKKNVRE